MVYLKDHKRYVNQARMTPSSKRKLNSHTATCLPDLPRYDPFRNIQSFNLIIPSIENLAIYILR